MNNPYKGLPHSCFWSRAMTDQPPWQIDPVTSSQVILPHEKVATLGSCFAQHIARHISSAGLNYFVAEQAPDSMDADEARLKNYNVFSARYGNVYTVRQALQLFTRAFGKFSPQESVWKKGGRFVDPFRPQIEPDGFASAEDLEADRDAHLSYVREIFLSSDWIVFTLGLTEAWESKLDGAIFPTAPGVAGGNFNPELHTFKNFSIDEVRADLFELIEEVAKVNPNLRFILTVSPVPLMATHENRHVWVSTSYSKAVLRVACEEAEHACKKVIYFPSYEIITSPAAGNSYYADDLRKVLDVGVQHVMRAFSAHFLPSSSQRLKSMFGEEIPSRSIHLKNDVICDEEVLKYSEPASRSASGSAQK